MSVLSELGKFIGEKHRYLLSLISSNETAITDLQSEITDIKGESVPDLQSQIDNLQTQINILQTTGSVHTNDISIHGAEKGVILQSEDYTQYRLRITSDKKLIIDDVTNGANHINEIQLTEVDNDIDEIGEMTIGEDFEID